MLSALHVKHKKLSGDSFPTFLYISIDILYIPMLSFIYKLKGEIKNEKENERRCFKQLCTLLA